MPVRRSTSWTHKHVLILTYHIWWQSFANSVDILHSDYLRVSVLVWVSGTKQSSVRKQIRDCSLKINSISCITLLSLIQSPKGYTIPWDDSFLGPARTRSTALSNGIFWRTSAKSANVMKFEIFCLRGGVEIMFGEMIGNKSLKYYLGLGLSESNSLVNTCIYWKIQMRHFGFFTYGKIPQILCGSREHMG